LRRRLPADCGLFVVCAPPLTDLFEAMPLVDWVVPLGSGRRRWGWSELTRLRRLRPGVGLLCNHSFRDTLAFRLAGIPRLFGAAARGRTPLLTRAFPLPVGGREPEQPVLHHAGRYLAMAYALGAEPWPGDFPEFAPHAESELAAPELERARTLPNLLAVAPGAAYGPAKRWPEANFLAVCRDWLERGGSVVLLGTAAEAPVTARLARDLASPAVADLAGKTRLGELLSLLQQTRACLANDSGIMHLAAAVGLPGVAIFGSTDPTATGPLSSRWTILCRHEPCAPCLRRECPKGRAVCLELLTPDAAVAALRRLWPE